MKPVIRCKPALFLALLGTFFIPSADASTISWTNVNGGNWSAATNWSPNQVSGSSDNAIITNTGAYTVTPDTSATVNSLTLGGSGTGQQTLATKQNQRAS